MLTWMENLKTGIEVALKESQYLSALGVSPTMHTLCGFEMQCNAAMTLGITTGNLYIACKTPYGFMKVPYSVEWRFARNLILTMKSRK